jgi:Lon protease-like protein
LFPLPLVLFPGVPLPLHVFEPRYREMLADCLRGDREFGVLFRPDGIAERELPRGHVGCIAVVENSDMLPDGRSNVLVRGTQRFALDHFVETPHPYHVGETVSYPDTTESALALAPLATRVRALFERVGAAARTLADDSDGLPMLPDDPALLAFAIAALIDMEASARQRLLASRSAGDRLNQVENLLAPAVESLELRATVHVRAKTNGHGPHPEP